MEEKVSSERFYVVFNFNFVFKENSLSSLTQGLILVQVYYQWADIDWLTVDNL